MYYDDEARRFNFLSGILLGAILGTGVGLLISPSSKKNPRHLRDGASALKQGALELGHRAREEGVRGYQAAADRFGR